VLGLEYERRPDLEHVSVWAGRVEQYSAFAHCLGYLASLRGRGLAPFVDQFDAEQEALAPDVADQGVTCRECQQALPKVGADLRGSCHQVLLFDDGQNGKRSRACHGVAAEGAEQLDLLGEGPEQLGPCDQSGDREAVPHRLAHDHQVRRDSGGQEAPQVCAGPAMTGLHLISYHEPAPRPRHTG